MKYQEFLDYIYQRHSGNVKLGLGRMHKILSAMDYPNKKLKGIHLAGTNGKGSTAAMCEAISIMHGLKTGLNTSPHLIDYRERIRINKKNIELDKLIEIYKKWEKTFADNEASFFEITTALAFYYFLQNKVENAIFEVGLGGRLDGTNPFKSTTTVITSISYDHTKSLGKNIYQIAGEKAGIIKPKVPLILGHMSHQAAKPIESTAQKNNSPIKRFGKDFQISNLKVDLNGTSFDYSDQDGSIPGLKTNLLGLHQAHNAALAIAASKTYFNIIGIKPKADLIRKGLTCVNWIGRFQILHQHPLVIVDGAHNVEGVKSLISSLNNMYPKKKFIFVLAILRDKKLNQIFKNLACICKKMYISKNKSNRAAELELQEKYAKKYLIDYEIVENVVSATKSAIGKAKKNDIIVITGSLYTISEVLGYESLF